MKSWVKGEQSKGEEWMTTHSSFPLYLFFFDAFFIPSFYILSIPSHFSLLDISLPHHYIHFFSQKKTSKLRLDQIKLCEVKCTPHFTLLLPIYLSVDRIPQQLIRILMYLSMIKFCHLKNWKDKYDANKRWKLE